MARTQANSPFSAWPDFSDAEVQAVANVLKSGRVNYWTGGEGREFEREFAAWACSRYAVAVTNGTVALDLALKALAIGAGNEVVVSPRSFIASVSCVVTAGAIPVFADVDRTSGNLSAATIEAVLTPKTRAIIVVHLAGWPCDMPEIMELANRRGLLVIEDCAQAHGATINGKPVGSWGHVGCWSFCQDKIMTTGGEGGMVTTDDPTLWSAMWSYKDHGKDWDAVYNREHPPGFRWLHESFGTNWRMLEVQAAIGRIQLGKMGIWHDRRVAIADRIAAALEPFKAAIRVPVPRAGSRHAYYRQYVYIQQGGLHEEWNRDRVVAECMSRGIPIFQGSCSEIYLEKAFDNTGWRPPQRLTIARELGESSLAFVTHPSITDAEVDLMCKVVQEVLKEACCS